MKPPARRPWVKPSERPEFRKIDELVRAHGNKMWDVQEFSLNGVNWKVTLNRDGLYELEASDKHTVLSADRKEVNVRPVDQAKPLNITSQVWFKPLERLRHGKLSEVVVFGDKKADVARSFRFFMDAAPSFLPHLGVRGLVGYTPNERFIKHVAGMDIPGLKITRPMFLPLLSNHVRDYMHGAEMGTTDARYLGSDWHKIIIPFGK